MGTKISGVEDPDMHHISIVYAPDVAECVIAVVLGGDKAKGEIFHVACAERIKYTDLVMLFAE